METSKIEERLGKVEGAQLKTFKVKDILPNPYRHLDRYPIIPKKVERLQESFRATGFWSNIVARLRSDGRCEQAYGHHRRIALLHEYGQDAEVQVLIANIDDATMIKVMANENMEEWGASAFVMMETVRAIVQAYAEGKLELKKELGARAAQNKLRYAPSFVQGGCSGGNPEHPYTAIQIADFIGLKFDGGAPERIIHALAALELIEVSGLEEVKLYGLNRDQFAHAIERARKEWVAGQKRAREAEQEAEKSQAEVEKAKNDAERRKAEKEAARLKADAAKVRKQAAADARKQAEKVASFYKGDYIDPEIREADKPKKRTRREADKAADKARPRRRSDKTKDAETFGREVYNTLVKMLQEDLLKDKLDSMLEPGFVEWVPSDTKKSVHGALTGLVKRAQFYADRFKKATDKPPPKPVEKPPLHQIGSGRIV